MKTVRDLLKALVVVCLCMSAPAGAKLIQHLDASVPESVVVSGGAVQQWNDLSGNNNNAVKSIGTVTYPSIAFPGGPVGLDFGMTRNSLELFSAEASAQWLDLSAGMGGFTVVVVTYSSAVEGTWNDTIGNTSSTANGWGFRYNGDGAYQAYLNGNAGGNSPNGAIEAGDTTVWTHAYDAATGASELWTNQGDPLTATQAAADFTEGAVTLGTTSNGGRYFKGMIGEVMIYDELLSQAELEQLRADLVYKWVTPLEEKLAPGALLPEDGSVEMPLEGVILSWKPGMDSTAQDVYFGTDFDDVNTATPDNDPAGVYMRRQSEASFALPPLDYGQTYYWRVDSINGGAVYSSAVVSFDTIKYAYPMASEYITATASSSIEDVNAVNTVNGAGLNADNLHNTNLNDMWLSNLEAKGTPIWIQYDFGTLVKLNEMLVWNHNTLVENLMGWGIKDAEIEYTADGTTWLPLTEQPVTFEQAPGADGYAANTVVAFNDLAVQGVRINALSNFEGIVPLNMYGLSEVQFLTVPVQAADPVPANGQTAVFVNPTVSWGAGRGAVSHTLYISDDPSAVANETIAPIAAGLTDTTYDLAGLNMNTVYYWKVNEVGDTETWPGYVWSFTTTDSIVVDNMEFYRNAEGRWIWQTWVDGFEDPANGSTVGNGDLPETQIVHSGNQSLPMAFDNSSSPRSEATRTFDPTQDWTRSGIQKLALYFRFSLESTGGELYVKINGVKVAAVAVAVVDAWSPIVVDLAGAGIDVSKVGTLTIGVDGAGAKGVVYIDDIMLTN
ncbi:MAG TPA: LamG-like jellyroll fold domain-containing protein [Sedimentisphaerales bacterium]|nr:LamG-like jellyroll fold domain-containing protein [Sedimentisphaerales bacterium]